MSDELDVIEALENLSLEGVDKAITETESRLKLLKQLRKVVSAGTGGSSGNSRSRSTKGDADREQDAAIAEAAFACCSRAEWEFGPLRAELQEQLGHEVSVGKLRHILGHDERFQRNTEGRWTAD